MSQPDLFVVCKNCGSEVSPYITECPYCGQRIRKRAPKIDRSGGRAAAQAPPARARSCRGCAPRRSPASRPTPGPTPPSRCSLLCVVGDAPLRGRAAARPRLPDRADVPACDDEVWRWFVAPFLHADQLGYAFVALVPVGIFGTLLERRFGPLVLVALFVLCGRGRRRRWR